MESKISFKNDYSEGAHPKILETLIQTNLVQEPGYGADSICKQAKEYIIKETGNADSQIFFVSGGTQANLLVISHLLKPYESVIAADTGHIEVHETGAIENSGHKINLIPNVIHFKKPKLELLYFFFIFVNPIRTSFSSSLYNYNNFGQRQSKIYGQILLI